METNRLFLVKRGCPFCREAIPVINMVNKKLQYDKRIEIKDCWEFEEFKWDNLSLMEKLEKAGFDGYPYLYVDGVIIGNAKGLCSTPEQLQVMLETMFKKEFLF